MQQLLKQFDDASYDTHRRDRMPADDGTEPWDEDDEYIEHMQFECRMGRFV